MRGPKIKLNAARVNAGLTQTEVARKHCPSSTEYLLSILRSPKGGKRIHENAET